MSERKHDYIPHNPAQFNAFVKNLIQYVEQKTGGANPEWTHIPQERIMLLKSSHQQFEQAFNTALADPTHANILRRQEAQAATTAIVP
jgi:hypothetical protein